MAVILTPLPADATAERVVQHFQAEGFPGITEALLVRMRLKSGDRLVVEAAFERAQELCTAPPIREYFEIQPYGFYSEIRTLIAAKAAFPNDFGNGLAHQLPKVFFDAAPVVVDDALANDTKYDAMLKLSDNSNGYAIAVLLNDPNSSFFEYLETHSGYDWQQIIGTLGAAANTFVSNEDLL
ncbi:MAG: hypothetical protein ABIZ09_10905 [Rhodoferax sp.]